MANKELLFGITEYFDKNTPGFTGTVKSRISDFLVNEVDLAGAVLHLTELGTSKPSSDGTNIPPCGLLDPVIVAKIESFLSSSSKALEIEVPDDKDARRLLHQQIEARFPNENLLRTPKRNESGSHIIEFSRSSSHSTAFRRQEATRLNRSGDATSGYIHFILHKENVDTLEAVNNIARTLRVPPKCIQYAGVKDKRGKTVQKISVKFRDPERIAKFRHPGLLLGNFSSEKAPLHLGDLSGNRFQLVIRDIRLDDRDIVEKAVSSFTTGGFINYFGLQRFGTTDVSTCDVGKALLRSDWDAAVDLIMKPRASDNAQIAQCRKVWMETKDTERALRQLCRRACVESFVLKGLAKNDGKDLFGALQMIPRNMRTMYVHSYQSYLWNLAASYRMSVLGHEPIVGDLVFKREADGGGKRVKRGPEINDHVITLTETDLENYSLTDVLLPLPGYDVKFPDNAVTPFLMDLMIRDNLDLRLRHKIKDYSVSGDYRRVVGKPNDITWEIKRLDIADQDLLLSDGDLLQNRKLPPTNETGKFMALVVQFTLGSSMYATMAIREFMKRSSDQLSSIQSSLDEVDLDMPEEMDNEPD